jgi:molybdopterin-guanine dinucleotide biosynthesis protein
MIKIQNTCTASTTCFVDVVLIEGFSETCSVVAGTPTSISLCTAEGHFIYVNQIIKHIIRESK